MISDRDRLIELFKKTEYTPFPEMTMTANLGNQFTEYGLNCIVDYLLENGVIVQKQSEWENTKEPLGWQDVDCVECSACHETWILDEDFDFEFCKEVWKYCPNCGAKIKECEG